LFLGPRPDRHEAISEVDIVPTPCPEFLTAEPVRIAAVPGPGSPGWQASSNLTLSTTHP
jgi:hypothetical protein